MLKKFISIIMGFLIFAIGLILTDYFLPYMSEFLGYDLHGRGVVDIAFSNIVFAIIVFCFFGWLSLVLPPFITSYLFTYSERVTSSLSKIPTSDILVMVFGIGIGLILANLIGSPLARVPVLGPYVSIVLSMVLAIVGAKLALKKHTDIVGFFTKLPDKRLTKNTKDLLVKDGPLGDRLYSSNKLLDTSVIIDGRLMDIMAAGFVDGKLVVPNFVLEELQRLSDSADSMKRAKGRRGLDFVHDLQQSYKEQVVIVDNDIEDVAEVDGKLVRLAKQFEAAIITNDYNLNKVAEIQGIKVLNINELANAIKPIVMTGEEMTVYLVKEGKENGQAIAYLDDGTMIVVDKGRSMIGQNAVVVVSSVLQTAAGRIIFAQIKE